MLPTSRDDFVNLEIIKIMSQIQTFTLTIPNISYIIASFLTLSSLHNAFCLHYDA